MSGRTNEKWTKTDWVVLLVWGTGIVGVSVLWNQWAMAENGPKGGLGPIAALVFVVGVPVVFGAVAGFLIRAFGSWREVALLAGVGDACMATALYLQWVSDTRSCMPTKGIDCDTGYALGASLIFLICYVPFLGSAALARAVAVRGKPRAAVIPSAPEAILTTPWIPVGRTAWRWFSSRFRSASVGLKVAMLPLLVWAACFYVFLGPLTLDAAYWLLGNVAPIRRDRQLRIGISVGMAVAYVAAVFIWGLMTPD
jgi:hypothetical protein